MKNLINNEGVSNFIGTPSLRFWNQNIQTMKRFLFFACIACLLLSFTSCEKKFKAGEVTIYGTVVDATIGDPIPVVEISTDSPYLATSSAVTGSDGAYELTLTIPDETSYGVMIWVEKVGYGNTWTNIQISYNMIGKRIQQSFTLKKN